MMKRLLVLLAGLMLLVAGGCGTLNPEGEDLDEGYGRDVPGYDYDAMRE